MRKSWKQAGLGALNLLAVIGVIFALQPVLRRHYLSSAVGESLLALAVVAVYIAASKWIERREVSELNPRRFLPEVAGGFALGLILFAATMMILWIASVYRPARGGGATGLASGLMGAIIAGILEEILFRGLLFRLSAKILGTWGALLFTSALFGAAHAFNPGATVGSSLAIAIEAGILLGAAYAATQRLWVPIGLHIGWNFTEGSIFSMAISGTARHEGLIQGSLSGPAILTGGQFGPEASIVAVVVCLIAGLYFIRRVVRLDATEPPAWVKTNHVDRASLA